MREMFGLSAYASFSGSRNKLEKKGVRVMPGSTSVVWSFTVIRRLSRPAPAGFTDHTAAAWILADGSYRYVNAARVAED